MSTATAKNEATLVVDVIRADPSPSRRDDVAVLAGVKAAEKILKPGVTWRELDRAAAKEISDRGFADVSYKRFHGLGHYVGMQVHDLARRGSPMKEGMVITIEPGMPFPETSATMTPMLWLSISMKS